MFEREIADLEEKQQEAPGDLAFNNGRMDHTGNGEADHEHDFQQEQEQEQEQEHQANNQQDPLELPPVAVLSSAPALEADKKRLEEKKRRLAERRVQKENAKRVKLEKEEAEKQEQATLISKPAVILPPPSTPSEGAQPVLPIMGPKLQPGATAPLSSEEAANKAKAIAALRETKKKEKSIHLRYGGGKVWQDPTLDDWPDNDYRLFCGDLGNEVNDNTLSKMFQMFPSFVKAKVIRDTKTQKTKGYGFASFMDPYECQAALKDVNGKYCGNRPIKLRKSTHFKREFVPKTKTGGVNKGIRAKKKHLGMF